MIEDGVFIGSDSQLVAPVTVGKGAYVGSRLDRSREDVPAGALAVARGKQRNNEGWVGAAKRDERRTSKDRSRPRLMCGIIGYVGRSTSCRS